MKNGKNMKKKEKYLFFGKKLLLNFEIMI